MKPVIASLTIGACLLLPSVGVVLAANPHSPSNPAGQPTGQPSQSCGSTAAPNTPGNAVEAAGSAFNPAGQAPSVYAGQQPQNSTNPKSVAQYDVACFQQP